MQAVRADEQVALGSAPVRERGHHAPVRQCRGVDEALAVLDGDAAACRLVAEPDVEVRTPDGLADRARGVVPAHREVGQRPAGRRPQREGVRVEAAEVVVVDAQHPEGGQAVRGEVEVGADAVRGALVRLVN